MSVGESGHGEYVSSSARQEHYDSLRQWENPRLDQNTIRRRPTVVVGSRWYNKRLSEYKKDRRCAETLRVMQDV